MTIEQVIARAAEIDAELAELEARDELDEDDEVRFDALVEEGIQVAEQRAALEARASKIARIREAAVAAEDGDGVRAVAGRAPQFMKQVEHREVDFRTGSASEVRDAALKAIEVEGRNVDLASNAAAHVEKLVRSQSAATDGDKIARRILATENPAYRSAFNKLMTESYPILDNDEQRAVLEFRAASQSLSDASGGYGVPVLIDPTIILTTAAADNPILRVARVETITSDEIRTVNSAPAAWSFDAESATVSNDQLTFGATTVTTYKAQGFVPFTIEIGMDYPSFAARMSEVVAQGYMDLLASQLATGATPVGIFTAIDANAAREVLATTSGQLGPADVLKMWNALGERWRSRATWIHSVSVESRFRNGGDNNGFFTVDLTAGGVVQINGRPAYTTDYAPAFTGTTGTVNLAIVGDFSNYLVAQRAGMNVELIPHLFDVTDNRPIGQRGYYAWARVGADSVNDNAFVLLKNTT